MMTKYCAFFRHYYGKIVAFICLVMLPIFAFSGLEHREYFEKYRPEIRPKIENELISQKVCINDCLSNTYWTMSPRKKELETSFFIPKDKTFNRAKIIDIFSEIHARDNINITLTFWDGSHKDFEFRRAKKVAVVKFITYP